MTPYQAYLEFLKKNNWQENQHQQVLMHYFDKKSKHLQSWFSRNKTYGTYLWGGVGVGKSALAQIFFEHTNIKKKAQFSCHSFLQFIQNELHINANKKNPLQKIAKQLAKNYKLIFIDEFEITDISMVMLFAPIINYLINNNTYLVFTSNTAIANLYLNGLQRNHLLFTLQKMQNYFTEIELHGKDYRPGTPSQGVFLLDQTPGGLKNYFYQQNQAINSSHEFSTADLILLAHPMKVIGRACHVLWVDFLSLCNIPRCVDDYQLIATQFKVVCIESVPQFVNTQNNLITNFINLIDILYANKVQVFISSKTKINNLCPQNHLLQEKFKRTASRLTELCKETIV
jgi:cell division protein ZapE